ncbi:MAG: hypothetical protein M1826_006721 [Phylliscum demangeonii]|nr:MAG: hypothetical protein M1826_006721 [Phylliscum demangeonii]
MAAAFDPPCARAGTLHLPSPTPTHLHRHDPTAAIVSLRRSLSRSPSRGPAFRLVPAKSPSMSPASPRTASPLSLSLSPSPSPSPSTPSRRGAAHAAKPPPSPLAVPFPPSARIQRTAVRRLYPTRASSRTRASPPASLRHPLTVSRDEGNASPASTSAASARSAAVAAAAAKRDTRSASPADAFRRDRVARPVSMYASIEMAAARIATDGAMDQASATPATARAARAGSPLKRSDALLSPENAGHGSPVAKRRSMHANAPPMPHESGRHDAGPSPGPAIARPRSPGASSPFFASMPKRSSSLRKSTLQQRYGERPLLGPTSRPHADLAFDLAPSAVAAALARARPARTPLDNIFPAVARDGLVTATPTAGPPAPGGFLFGAKHGPAQPHPLSQTISQSSSASSIADESPTHPPFAAHPTAAINFTRSLPIGAMRPVVKRTLSGERGALTDDAAVVTPQNYRLVKPLPAAFLSTGLISKRNRNPEDILNAGRAIMPDTPCKRPAAVAFQSKGRRRRYAPAVTPAAPATPLHPPPSRPTTAAGTGVGIFGASFVDDSPSAKGHRTHPDHHDLPPTPTRHGHWDGSGMTAFPIGLHASLDSRSCESLVPPRTPGADHADRPCTGSPRRRASARILSAPSLLASPSSARSLHGRARPGAVPAPLSALSLLVRSSNVAQAKRVWRAPASPIDPADPSERSSPHTPRESVLPPDPSGLSISGHASNRGRAATAAAVPGSGGGSIFAPATPTGVREGGVSHNGRVTSITALGVFAPHDVDVSLTSRFDKVELIGTGEFSQVYRVTQADPAAAAAAFFSTPRSSAPRRPEHVYAVKRSRHAYTGGRDRERKLQEVEVLRALGPSDHTVHMMDFWDAEQHLYIQTEFCEEGSLDLFLAQVGRKARLDDFRIWKILLELSLGLQHIHDRGFIHLDLKPANVLITFEGVLKIADFGMAARWPAQAGIEGEGDREYIGPEILMGHFDKPADIFALGLMMLEIAGNVELPDNGPSWQKLRAGDMSDVPSLTWSSASHVHRDSSGNPLSPRADAVAMPADEDDEDATLSFLQPPGKAVRSYQPCHDNLYRDGELRQPPAFMTDPNHPEALDRIVRWMISPRPPDRPLVDHILNVAGVKWAEARRRAGATVFEGNWGPADDVLSSWEEGVQPMPDVGQLDAEMVDV